MKWFGTVLMWSILASQVFAEDTPANPAQQTPVATIPLGCSFRANDMTLSPDGKRAWICSDYRTPIVYSFDAEEGRCLGAFGRVSQPSVIHYHTADRRLYVVDVSYDLGRGAHVSVFDPATDKPQRTISVEDWRLRFLVSAAFSDDGKWLWLTSGHTESSHYGDVPAALFRVDLEEGNWEQLAGPPSDRISPPGLVDRPERHLWAVSDAGGRLFVTSLKPNTLSVFPDGAKKPANHVNLGFYPEKLCTVGAARLLAAGDGQLVVVDTKQLQVMRRAEFEGNPSAVCTDGRGQRAYVAIAETNTILSVDVSTGKLGAQIDLSKKAGRDVHGITRLFWADKPARLIGIAGHKYLPFVLNLEDGKFAGDRVRDPCRLRIDRENRTGLVCFQSGHLAVVDLKTDRFAGTIRVGGRPTDVVFAGKGSAIVADRAGRCLLRVDLAAAKVTGRISLTQDPLKLAPDATGTEVGVRLDDDDYQMAVVRLADDQAQYYRKLEDLPAKWKDLEERTRSPQWVVELNEKFAYEFRGGPSAPFLAKIRLPSPPKERSPRAPAPEAQQGEQVIPVANQTGKHGGDAVAPEPKWSETVKGLQYRLYVAPHDPAKTRPVDALTFEIRNVTDEPIEISTYNGKVPDLHIRITDYRELDTLPAFAKVRLVPFALQPRKTWTCKVSDGYLIAYGRSGGGDFCEEGESWVKFDPAGKTYEISARPNPAITPDAPFVAAKLELPARPEPAVYWPPTGKPAPLSTTWSQPTEVGLQTRIAAHAKSFVLGKSIPMRVELRHKDMKDWNTAVALTHHLSTITVSDVTGKQVGQSKAMVFFHGVRGAFQVLGLFDLSRAKYGIDKPGKYSVRFDSPPNPAGVDFPASPAFQFEVRGR